MTVVAGASNGPIVLVGGGKMGGALLAGWLDRGIDPHRVRVIEPNAEAAQTLAKINVQVDADAAGIAAAPDVVVLAVKPQVMDQVVPAYARFAGTGTAFLSIAAGRTILSFEKILGDKAAILRAMPNTPAAVRRGITVICANANVTAAQRTLAGDLLAAVGAVEWIEDESLMDAVTAVSGSGPAYVFLLAEQLAEAGRQAGLPADMAARLARATVAGAGELLHKASEPAATLRQNVTSPGGTTAEALKVLMADDGSQPVLTRAVLAATRRSRELAG